MTESTTKSEATHPLAVSADDIRSDAPELTPLLNLRPGLLIYTKSNANFHDVGTIFNHAVGATPRAIIRPLNEDDLSLSISFCAREALPMSVRSGGHDLHGRALIQDGVVIDVRGLTSVNIVAGAPVPYAVVGPGVKTGDLLRVLDENGLVTPVGWCSEVSYIGWAAGGGYGVLTGYYGMGADQILGGRVATPSGMVIDTDDDPELLWALRGAGLGNFGVIVELRVKVYPRPRVLAGILAFPYEEAGSVLGNFEAACEEDLPSAFSGEVMAGDSGSGMTMLIYYNWVLDDNEEQGLEHLRRMRGLGTLVQDTVERTTPYGFGQLTAPWYKPHRSTNVHSVAVASFSPEVSSILAAHPPPATANLAIHQAHGRATATNPHAAFAMRRHHLIVCIQGTVYLDADPAAKAEAFEWAAKLHLELREKGLALDQGYWSMTAPEFCDSLTFFGEAGVRRLKDLKVRYNPGDAFPQAYPVLDAS